MKNRKTRTHILKLVNIYTAIMIILAFLIATLEVAPENLAFIPTFLLRPIKFILKFSEYSFLPILTSLLIHYNSKLNS